MLKVMIADDEVLFREFLSKAIDWTSHGFVICCEAKDGLEALEKTEEFMPDIVLADINMPFLNGLEMSKELKIRYPEIEIVVITGQGEFEYARKALKIGVKDFLLKPFEKDELLATMLKIKENLDKQRDELNELDHIKQQVESGKSIMREHLLNDLLENETELSDMELKEQFKHCGIVMQSTVIKIAVVEIDRVDDKWDKGERILWKFAVGNLMKEIISVKGNHIVVNGPQWRIVSLIAFNDCQAEQAFAIDEYETLCAHVKKYLKFTITVGVGRTYEGLNKIKSSYQEASIALQNKFMHGSNKTIIYDELIEKKKQIDFYPAEINDELRTSLRMDKIEDFEKKLEDVFMFIKSNRLSIDLTYVICMGIVSICLSYINETGNEVEEVFGDKFYPYSDIKNKETVDDVCVWIKNMFLRAIQYCRSNKMTRSKKIVALVKECIEQHMGNSELNIKFIANLIYVNPGHLRAVFKKETGMTINDYMTDLKMKQAKKIIGIGNIKLSEVADMLGYSDAFYFSKCFKKYYGINPSEYENLKN